MIDITSDLEMIAYPVGTILRCEGNTYEVVKTLGSDGCFGCPEDIHPLNKRSLLCSKVQCQVRTSEGGHYTILKKIG